MTRRFATAGLAVLLASAVDAEDRVLRAQLALDVPLADVWQAWTTEEGVKSFFAPGCRIEPKVDGLYEIYFNPAAETGRRGADGMRILGFEPLKRLVFTWNAPFDQAYVRAQRTIVTLDFEAAGERRTRLTFTHAGWGHGPEWDKAYAYFDGAWNAVVLPNLKHRLAKGPIDWANRPQLAPVAKTLQMTLVPGATASQ